jgi:hypothetical protein
MVQLSLIPAFEAARFQSESTPVQSGARAQDAAARHLSPMAPANRPTPAQVAYLKKLTRIRSDAQLARFVMRQLGLADLSETQGALTKHHFAQVIDKEVAHKRWAA